MFVQMLWVFVIQNDVFERAVYNSRYDGHFTIKGYQNDIKR